MHWPAFTSPEGSRCDCGCYELQLGQDGCVGSEDVFLFVEGVSGFGRQMGCKMIFVCLERNWLVKHAYRGGWVSCLYGLVAQSNCGRLLLGVTPYKLGLVWLYAHAMLLESLLEVGGHLLESYEVGCP